MNKLLEQRNAAAAVMRSIVEGAAPEGLTAEEQEKFDRAEADYDRLDATIERTAKLEALKAPVDTMVAAGGSSEPVKTEQHRAFEAFIRSGFTGSGLVRATDDLEKRAQGVATNAAGGFLVPDDFRAGIIRAIKTFGGIEALVQTLPTNTGTDLSYPTVDDTGNVGELIGENTAVTEQDVIVGNKVLKAFKWSSKLVRVSNELLQDEEYNLETELGSLLGERIGRVQAPFWITGTGVNQPEGILTNKAASVTTVGGATTTLGNAAQAQDLLIDLELSLDEGYLANATYLMRRSTLGAVRKIRDADGRAIWQPSMTAGEPATINGYPVRTDTGMPAMAAGAKIIAFGDLRRAYVIRQVRAVAIRRLNERYAEFDQAGFIGFTRADGQVQNGGAYVVAANAAV